MEFGSTTTSSYAQRGDCDFGFGTVGMVNKTQIEGSGSWNLGFRVLGLVIVTKDSELKSAFPGI